MTEITEVEQYINPPLKSVSCEIRFPTLLTISAKIPEFQVMLRDIFPDYYTQTIPRAYKGGVIDEIWWVFKSSNDALNLKVKNNSIVLTSTKYTSFTPFFNIIKENFEEFFNLNSLDRFLRIGLRFTNREDFENKESDLNILLKYFKLRFFKFNETDSIESFSVRYKIKEGDYSMNVGEDYNINPQGKYFYIFDFDSYIDKNVNKENYKSVVENLHKEIIKTFENYITDEYRNEILKVEK